MRARFNTHPHESLQTEPTHISHSKLNRHECKSEPPPPHIHIIETEGASNEVQDRHLSWRGALSLSLTYITHTHTQ